MARSNVLRVYLDIDGTILYYAPDGQGTEEMDFQYVCDGLGEFLHFVVNNCQPYWLSMRSRLGKTSALEERLFPNLPAIAATIPVAYCSTHWSKRPRPARAHVLKSLATPTIKAEKRKT